MALEDALRGPCALSGPRGRSQGAVGHRRSAKGLLCASHQELGRDWLSFVGNSHRTFDKAPTVGSPGPGEEPPNKPKALLGPDHKAQLPGLTDEEAGPQRLTHSPKAQGLVAGSRPREFFSFP